MNTFAYARYELLRTFRNKRFFIFSFGFPLILYYAIAAPSRNVHDLNHSGISAPMYYMVGLVAFGTMNAVLGSGAGRCTRALEVSGTSTALEGLDVVAEGPAQ